MSDYDIEQSAELAAQAFIRSLNLSWVQPPDDNPGGADRVYCGLEGLELESEGGGPRCIELPCVIVSCQSADAVLPHFHGNWNASLQIQIRSQSDLSTGAMHAARVREISRAFYTTTIHGDLSNAIPEFWTASVVPIRRGWDRDGRVWVSTLEFTLISCSSTHIAD